VRLLVEIEIAEDLAHQLETLDPLLLLTRKLLDGAHRSVQELVDHGTGRSVDRFAFRLAEASRRFMEALRAGEGFAYRYVPRPGVDVRGWYPTFGLRQALALAGWLARPGAA